MPLPVRKVLRIGYRQRDLLDSLRTSGPATVAQLARDTGSLAAQVYESLGLLLEHELVSRDGHRLTCAGALPWIWEITKRGRQALRRRQRIGMEPGVPSGSELKTPRSPAHEGRVAQELKEALRWRSATAPELARWTGRSRTYVCVVLGALCDAGIAQRFDDTYPIKYGLTQSHRRASRQALRR